MSKSNLEERLVKFAVLIIKIAEELPHTMTGKHMAGQMIRSGTSPALNYGEASVLNPEKISFIKLKLF